MLFPLFTGISMRLAREQVPFKPGVTNLFAITGHFVSYR